MNAALFISTLILEELELSKEDIESGSVTADDLLASCLIPDAARLTGVVKGTKSNPLLEAVPAVTIVGARSAALVGETAVLGMKLKSGAEASFEDMLAEMDEETDVTLSDCIGTLAPNLLAAFGTGKSKRDAFADDLLSGRVISLPASLVDINGTGNRPFILIEPRDGASGAAKTFVALELSEEHTRHLQEYTLTLLEAKVKTKVDAGRRKLLKPADESDAESEAPSDGSASDSDDDNFDFDLSGVDPSLLGILGGDDHGESKAAAGRKQSILTTWTPPAQAGLDNSLDGLELAKQRRMEAAVVLAIAA